MDIVFCSDNIYFVRVNNNLIDDYLKMLSDKELVKNITRDNVEYTYQSELEWVLEKKNSECYSMIEKDTLEFIGNIEFMNIDNGCSEIGIAITKNKQNKGYGTEALKRIIRYGIEVLKLNNIYLNVYNFNKRAIHVYEKIGFVIDGVGKTEEDYHMTYILNK